MLISSLVVFLILLVLQPFGISGIRQHKFWILVGFMGVTAVSLSIPMYVFGKLFPKFYKEETTLKSWNSLLGKETIDLYNTSVTKGNQESHGQNFQKLGKDLMSVDELAVMDGGKCLLQIRGVRPFLSRKYDITKHPNYKLLSDFNEKNAFNIEKFLSTRMPMRPGERYRNYEVTAEDLASQTL